MLVGSIVFWSTLRFAGLPFTPQFFAAYVTALTLSMLFAAVVLVFRARLVGDGSSAHIAAAFVYTVPVIATYAITFPGLGPATMAHPEASAWLSLAWRIGWPVAVAWYALRPLRRPAKLARTLSIALACSAVAIALVLGGRLPTLSPGHADPYLVYAANGIVAATGALTLTLLLRKRPMTTLDTWLAVSLALLMTGSVLLCLSTSRYSAIATAVRISNLTSSCIVACALVYEFQRLLVKSSALDRFMTMAQYASTIVYLLDASGSCAYVNRRWVEVTGQNAEDALGTGWTGVVHPDDLLAVRAPYRAALAAKRPHELELRYRGHDGSYRWFLASATPTFDAHGNVDGWYGSATDVDSQHRALEQAQRLEREAAERESDIRRIAETIPMVAWTANHDGAVDWANRRWFEYTGQSFDEAMEAGWRAVQHPDDVAEVQERWRNSLETASPFEREFRIRAADGTYRWFLTRALPVRDDGGRVIKWYGTSTDTDDLRRQSDQLSALYAREHELAEKLQTAFIPAFLPNVAGLAFQAVYRPALRERELGGDWYDAFVLRDGRIALSIGDIAGHGIDAALAMVRLRETLRALTGFAGDTDPGTILELADRGFIATHPHGIATAAFAVYDPATRRLVHARAGHPPLALVRNERATFLPSDPGIPLGVQLESRFISSSCVLEEGDAIVLYTDGLLEMDRDVVGGERIFAAMLERYGEAEDIVNGTLGESQRDDVALLKLSVLSAAEFSSWHFESDDAGSAGDARFAFTAHLRRRISDNEAVGAAELVFGELVGNVVRHAPGSIQIELAWRAERPFLIVRDRGPRFDFSAAELPDDALAVGGRGMFLIASYASIPIVLPRTGGGNEVIVALQLPAAEDPAPAALEVAEKS